MALWEKAKTWIKRIIATTKEYGMVVSMKALAIPYSKRYPIDYQ